MEIGWWPSRLEKSLRPPATLVPPSRAGPDPLAPRAWRTRLHLRAGSLIYRELFVSSPAWHLCETRGIHGSRLRLSEET